MHAEQNSHNTLAYPGFPYPHTHPDSLAAMAILHGLNPAPVEHCRVLEIGCNEGANLIPMAYAIPASEFVGFDLAGLRIERGQERIRELGLTNVRLFQADMLDVGADLDAADLGQFDYIIAHGFYAWVPEPVRERMMALCGELLAPDGVAFVSYNAKPGGHLRMMIREMMLEHVKGIEEPLQRMSESIAFLHFLVQSRPEGDSYRLLIQNQLAQMERRNLEGGFHDWLTDAYHPASITEFAGHAQKHGLQYLCEAALPPIDDPWFRSEIRSVVEKASGGDILKQEQMLDSLRVRMYRETLLCRADRAIRRDFPAENLRRLMLASPAESTPGEAPGVRVFSLPAGSSMESNHAGAIALIELLAAHWPRPVSLRELEPRLAGAGLLLDGEGFTLLMRLIVARFVEIHAWSAPVAEEISTRPRVSLCARLEAGTREFAPTLLHGTLKVDDPVLMSFVQLLDGIHDRAELLDAMGEKYPELTQERIEAGIESSLRLLYRAGMLEA
jgi:SAM-dependent methyltransferase